MKIPRPPLKFNFTYILGGVFSPVYTMYTVLVSGIYCILQVLPWQLHGKIEF